MENIEENKKTQEDLWREVLYSADNESIKEALKVLRDQGNIKILPDIFNLYKGYKGTELGKDIYNFLGDVKCADAANLFVELIKNPEYAIIKKDILTLCWQTSLDFAEHLTFFVDLFIKSEMQSAFEAFTVIEYMEIDSQNPAIEEAITKLQISIDEIGEEKKELLVDLVNILREKQI